MDMAVTVYNGDNETHIGLSRSISYGLYDEANNEIAVRDQMKPIEFWIPRDTNATIDAFQLIRVVNASTIQNKSSAEAVSLLGGSQLIRGFLVNGFNMSGVNSSIHIQIKPENKSISYLTLLKFGTNPNLDNATNMLQYDLLNVFCPPDLVREQNDSFYLIFANMSRVNGYRGYVGFSISEIDSTQLDCQNKSRNTVAKLMSLVLKQNGTFSDDFSLRIYLSGCYYIDETTNNWISDGMEILSDTNVTHTHCLSSHLTTFAGGFIVLPTAINFDYVWSHASFAQNPVIYSTVITLVSLYVLLGVWAKYMDSMDMQKMGIAVVGAGVLARPETKYIYEMIVFTGSRLNAGTVSKVSCILASEDSESDIIELQDPKRRLFQRGGIDSFILLLDKSVF